MSVAEVEDRTEPEEADGLSWRAALIALLLAGGRITMERKNVARPWDIHIESDRRFAASGEPYLVEQPVSENLLRALQGHGVVSAGRIEAIPLTIPLTVSRSRALFELNVLGGFKIGLARCLPCYAPVGCQASRGGPIIARHLAPGVKGPCPGSGTTPTEYLDRDPPDTEFRTGSTAT